MLSCAHMHAQSLSHFQLFVIPWTEACQAPRSMRFSRKEYWSELPFPPPRDLPNHGTEPTSSALAGRFFTSEPSAKPLSQLEKDFISQGFFFSWTCAQLCSTCCNPMDCNSHQAPLSMGFSRQECWSELPFPPPRDLPDSEIKRQSHISCIGRQVLYH